MLLQKLQGDWFLKGKGCCVFRPAFGCCTHPKSWLKYFFELFSTFFLHFKRFLVIFAWNQEKNIKKRSKKLFIATCWSKQYGFNLVHHSTTTPETQIFLIQKKMSPAGFEPWTRSTNPERTIALDRSAMAPLNSFNISI